VAALTLARPGVSLNGVSHYEQDLREGEPPPLPVETPRHYPTHPLFPLPEGVRETKEIHEITFDRWSDKGVKERCPDRFSASELTSLAQVVDMFGGGTYQFIAFDSRGNFSRWTPEKEKVRIDLPSKPFRQSERVEAPAPETHAPARPGQAPADYLAVLVQQSMAAQERADRLMTALIDRLATPPPQPLAPPPPPPPPDPIAMLTGLAGVLEKLRPAQAGDMVGQLSGLVSIVKQLKGSQPSEGPSQQDDIALQPFLSMVTNAMLQNSGRPQATNGSTPQQPRPPAPASPPDLVWVLVPGIGPVMMRPEQASRMTAGSLTAAPAPPPTPPSAGAPVPSASPLAGQAPSPSSAASAPQGPAVAGPAALASTPGPVRPRAAAAPQTPVADVPAPVAPPVATLAPAVASQAERCIVCGEPGQRDPAQPTILRCRHNHRSLVSGAAATSELAPPPQAGNSRRVPAGTVEGGNLTISAADLDAMLADPDVLQALSPDITAALQQVRAQLGEP